MFVNTIAKAIVDLVPAVFLCDYISGKPFKNYNLTYGLPFSPHHHF